MGKGLKEFQLCDSRRLRKKPRDAQDDVTLNSSICLMPIFGFGKVCRIWTPKGGPLQFSTWMFVSSFLPFVVSCFLANFSSSWVRSERHVAIPKQDCHTLQRVDLARPFLVSPAIKIEIENSLEMTLSKAKSGSVWQSRFWQCGTLRPARNTKLFTYITQVKQSWVLFKQQAFNATVQHVDVCVILPAFCGFMVSGKLLKQLGAFRASCRNPKNRIATRSNAWIWRARFWSRLLLK